MTTLQSKCAPAKSREVCSDGGSGANSNNEPICLFYGFEPLKKQQCFNIFILKNNQLIQKYNNKSVASAGSALEIFASQHLFGDHFLVFLEGSVKSLQALFGHHPQLSR